MKDILLSSLEQAIEDIKKANLDITIEGDLQDFLGINITRKGDGTIHLAQPHLIDQILKDLSIKDDTKPKTTLASSSRLLSRHSFPQALRKTPRSITDL